MTVLRRESKLQERIPRPRPRLPRGIAFSATSSDGRLTLRMFMRPTGLHVERLAARQTRPSTTSQRMRFVNHESFTRWCDADRLQLTYPHLWDRARRSGHALLDR